MSDLSPFQSISELVSGSETPVDWIVPGVVPRGSLIALAGVPGAGKSFFSYSLSLALSTGTPFLGWELSPRRVLYFDQENSRPDVQQYLRWAYNGLGRPDLSLADANLALSQFSLGGPNWAATASTLSALARPDLIVLDTTTPICNISDENDNGEATRAILNIRKIQGLFNPQPAVIAIKHAKYDKEGSYYTLRGAKAWEGAVDSVIFHVKSPGKPRSDGLTVTRLIPSKTRAFGLRETLNIEPEWIDDRKGLKLSLEHS